METAQKFAQIIKEARLDARMTQQQVAGEAGLTPNYYARVERGEVNPTVETIENIAIALKITINFPIKKV